MGSDPAMAHRLAGLVTPLNAVARRHDHQKNAASLLPPVAVNVNSRESRSRRSHP